MTKQTVRRAMTARAWVTAVLAFGAILLVGSPTLAAFLRNVPQTVIQPDGTVLHCYASGDEYFNWLHDENGFVIIQNHNDGFYVYATKVNGKLVPSPFVAQRVDPAMIGLTPNLRPSPEFMQQRRQAIAALSFSPEGRGNAPTKGVLNNVVIFIRFSDEDEYTDPTSLYDTLFNSTEPGADSLKAYYLEASYQQLTIDTSFFPTAPGETVVSYQDTHPRAYYQPYDYYTNPIGYQDQVESAMREQTLLKNAVQAVAPQIPSSLVVDSDGDGDVDNVCFIVTGNATGWSDLLWPHMWTLQFADARINGKRVWEYNFQLRDFTISEGAGVLCHEMFHSLGAPDLYHYSYIGIPVGEWDLMEQTADPPQHMGAYMKYRYGKWISSIPEITSPGTYTLNPLTSPTGNSYRIASNSPSEYFVVEYRKQMGTYESSLPGTGMLVYRINTAQDGYGNNYGPPDEVYIYRPNGTLTQDGYPALANFSADVGRTKIDDTTDPSSFLSDGSLGGLKITDVSAAGDTISFTVDVGDATKVATPVFDPDGGTYPTALDVTITCPTDGAEIHYTTNGKDPTQADPIIASGGTVTISQATTLKAKAWKTGLTESDVKTADYVITSSKVSTPTFSPDGGTFYVAQRVVVTCATEGATIHYTTNGSTPLESDPIVRSGSTILVDRSMTLKAKAWLTDFDPSDVKTAVYNIQIPIRYVRPNGDDKLSGQTWALAKRTLNAALKEAPSACEIWVAGGTYSERIVLKSGVAMYGGFLGNETSRDQRSWVANPTVIDGGAMAPVVSFLGGDGRSSVINGFTIRNGKGTLQGGVRYGGGVYCNSGSVPIIMNNTIEDNDGGAIYCYYSSPLIADNVIDHNTAGFGSAVLCWSSSPVIANNTIADNESTIEPAVVYCYYSSPTVENNILASNSAGVYDLGGFAEIDYNCLYNNAYYNYSGVEAGPRDLETDPGFRAEASRDYHIESGSLCIDAGDDTVAEADWFDMDGENRVIGRHVDIGADEAKTEPAVGTPTFDPDGGTFTSSQTVTITCATEGATIHYTTSGDEPTEADPTIASGSTLSVSQSLTLKARAWKVGLLPSDTHSADFAVTGVVATPVFSPDGGSFMAPTNVTITCATPGAIIYYTTDGSDPTESDLGVESGAAIPITKATTLKASAWKTGWVTSDIKTAVYLFPTMIHVKPTGSDASDGSNWKQAKRTIQAGINAAASGDEVWVAAGTYFERITIPPGVSVYGGFAGNETLRNQRNYVKHISLLDGKQTGPVVTFAENADSNTRIDGFTIWNGYTDNGGGIYCSTGSPNISNNVLTYNTAEYDGGAIYAENASPVVLNNVINWNTAGESGGGICCDSSQGAILNNTIHDNAAGGVGGGIYCASSNVTIANNIIAFNSFGVYASGLVPPELSYNCVFGNGAGDYEGVLPGVGDFSVDPGFVDRAKGDCHILPTSVCVDVGDDVYVQPDELDTDGQMRVYGSHVDVGADEWMPSPPTNVSLSPRTGRLLTGSKLRLTSTYLDEDGYDDIASCYLLVNTYLIGTKALYLRYDAVQNALYVRDDDNTVWVGGFAPGSDNVIENSYCKLYCADTTIEGTGGTLTVKWSVELKDTMGGRDCSAWMQVFDRSGRNEPWTQMGSRLIVGQPPATVSLTPNSGKLVAGVKTTLSSVYSDPDGYDDLSGCVLLINKTLSGMNTLYAYYDANTNKLYIRDDANTVWQGGYAPGSPSVLENGYFKLYCAETTVSKSGNNVTVKWRVEIKSTMVGRQCTAWMLAIDDGGGRAGWNAMGTFTTSLTNQPPVNVSVSPNSGSVTSGTSTTFVTKYYDPNGYEDLSACYVLVNTWFTGTNAVYLRYDTNANKLYIRDDANTKWVGGYAPGSAHVLENSYCKLDCAGTTKSGSGITFTVNWKITVKSPLAGKTCGVWSYVFDDADARDGWDRMGTITVK